MTQSMPAEKPGTAKQFISGMVNERKPISNATAKELFKIFDGSASRFI